MNTTYSFLDTVVIIAHSLFESRMRMSETGATPPPASGPAGPATGGGVTAAADAEKTGKPEVNKAAEEKKDK